MAAAEHTAFPLHSWEQVHLPAPCSATFWVSSTANFNFPLSSLTYTLVVTEWQWFLFCKCLSSFLSYFFFLVVGVRKERTENVLVSSHHHTTPLAAAVTWRFFGANLLSPSANVILVCFMTLPLVRSCCAFLNVNWAFSEAQIMNRLVLCGCFIKQKMQKYKSVRGD